MYRASTPRHVFYFDFDAKKTLKNILITYAQDGEIILEKKKDDLEFDTEDTADGVLYRAFYQLTQEETKLFDKRPFATVQVRMLDNVGHVITSPMVRMRVEKVLNDEVLK